ncbi:hypothetical protein HanHA300_Chr08g0285061 [Helianthus annuus]|nr:hypothetical protein HanHA300_Chr08g0285061 [Helianthus annuus]KAJ0719625.1 hypothetical protein HanLR1_Chr08g0283831 [Helianthus annuus]
MKNKHTQIHTHVRVFEKEPGAPSRFINPNHEDHQIEGLIVAQIQEGTWSNEHLSISYIK